MRRIGIEKRVEANGRFDSLFFFLCADESADALIEEIGDDQNRSDQIEDVTRHRVIE